MKKSENPFESWVVILDKSIYHLVELISGRKETSELSQNARSNQRETSAIRSAAVELPSLYSALCYEVRAAERVKRPLFDVIIAT